MLDICLIVLLPILNGVPDHTKQLEYSVFHDTTITQCDEIGMQIADDFEDEVTEIKWHWGDPHG